MIDLLLSAALTCDLECTGAARASALCADRRGVHYMEAQNLLCIDGPIDVAGRLRAAVVDREYRDGLIVVVRSDGGSLAGAIDIAEYLGRFRYAIVVDGICASACAQFLFMGADRKIIRGDGIVAMHGGPFSDAEIAAMPAAGHDNIRRERDRFVRFYAPRAGSASASPTTSPPICASGWREAKSSSGSQRERIMHASTCEASPIATPATAIPTMCGRRLLLRPPQRPDNASCGMLASRAVMLRGWKMTR